MQNQRFINDFSIWQLTTFVQHQFSHSPIGRRMNNFIDEVIQWHFQLNSLYFHPKFIWLCRNHFRNSNFKNPQFSTNPQNVCIDFTSHSEVKLDFVVLFFGFVYLREMRIHHCSIFESVIWAWKQMFEQRQSFVIIVIAVAATAVDFISFFSVIWLAHRKYLLHLICCENKYRNTFTWYSLEILPFELTMNRSSSTSSFAHTNELR